MSNMKEETITVAGVRTRILRGGTQGEPVVFIHGGIPGETIYCSSADLWQPSLDLFATQRRVVALDLPGAGGTGGASGDWLTVPALARHVRDTIEALRLGSCHIVGHDHGGLLALELVMGAPALARSLSIVASPPASPMQDSLVNFALTYPPAPLWSRASQAWAFERLSFAHNHIDAAMLDRCIAWSKAAGHQEARAVVNAGGIQRLYMPSIAATKGRFYEVCRNAGLPVPVQIVWATHDPLTAVENGIELYRAIAAKQSATHFHVINRAGSFPFREEPETFYQIVSAFHDGVAGQIG
jgi:2-hydroxy-6-oxonona-2,4-dienedioate hydrolase